MKRLAAAIVVLTLGCGGDESVNPFGSGGKGEDGVYGDEGADYEWEVNEWESSNDPNPDDFVNYVFVNYVIVIQEISAGHMDMDTVVNILKDLYLVDRKAWSSRVSREITCTGNNKPRTTSATVTIERRGNAVEVTQVSDSEKIEVLYSRDEFDGKWTATASRNDSPLNSCAPENNYFSTIKFDESPAQITTTNQAEGTCAEDVCRSWKRNQSTCEGVLMADFTSTFTNAPEIRQSWMTFTTTITTKDAAESKTCTIKYTPSAS